LRGRIVGHRLGGNRYYPRQLIIEVEGVGEDISAVIGRRVVVGAPCYRTEVRGEDC